MFKELPKPEEIGDYEIYLNLDYKPPYVANSLQDFQDPNNVFTF